MRAFIFVAWLFVKRRVNTSSACWEQPLFSSLSLHKQLIKACDQLGYTEATEVQKKTIPLALEGKDLLVSAETGSGKTAAFLLPVLDRMLNTAAPNTGTRVLILLPTRELALQTLKSCEQLMAFTPIKAGIIVGGEAFKHQVAMLRKNPEIIIATPGRLVEHVERNTPDFRDLEVLILDEADRMLEMGFSEDLLTIAKGCSEKRQNLLFSATLKGDINKIANTLLPDAISVAIHSPRETNAAITQKMVLADDFKHKDKLILALLQGAGHGETEIFIGDENDAEIIVNSKTMVFCNTRKQCDQLANWLEYKKIKLGVLHSEISQSDRKQIMNRFRQGHLQVLITTDVASRGLDIKGIEQVIHYNVPRSGDDYLHRSGRTGRAGETGTAVLLIDADEWNTMSTIERYLKTRFEHLTIPGLGAKYKGPKKVKKSGKAAGKKKDANKKLAKKTAKKNTKARVKKTTKKPATEKTEPVSEYKNTTGKKRRFGSAENDKPSFSPLKRRK
ncbi:MAG: DEAD/DEAH box helicase [Pseudomonadales bacterium]|nr:DEAD/DEAH box helicase [Pseudomonadales bacterium]